MRTSLGSIHARILATLGLLPLVSCGGTVSDAHGQAENGGRGGGSGGSSGVSAFGGLGGALGGSSGMGAGGGWEATGGVGGWYGDGGVWPLGNGGSAPGTLPSCTNPVPDVDVNGEQTGLVLCANGNEHRVASKACLNTTPRDNVACPFAVTDGGIPTFGCLTDKDCTEKPNGFCTGGGGNAAGCYCNYGCVTDADCGAGLLCLCGDPVGMCVPATCMVDSDCKEGLCTSYNANPGCGGTAFSCQQVGDQCLGDGDCSSGLTCTVRTAGAPRTCEGATCAIGRPFLVGGAARLAGVARRSDWSSELRPDVLGLEPDVRAALAGRWTEIALMEHASIAAFARFALELLSLGAPPELVVETHAAMADETRHARDAFALASAYAGSNIGPSSLDVDRALSATDPVDVVRTAILEGCIGETIAAVEAGEALAYATDPAVREALARVALDETRHAELAWRFVQWALSNGETRLREQIARELVDIVDRETTRGSSIRSSDATEASVLRAHGLLSGSARAEIRGRVLSEIVGPCARALASAVVPRAPALASVV